MQKSDDLIQKLLLQYRRQTFSRSKISFHSSRLETINPMTWGFVTLKLHVVWCGVEDVVELLWYRFPILYRLQTDWCSLGVSEISEASYGISDLSDNPENCEPGSVIRVPWPQFLVAYEIYQNLGWNDPFLGNIGTVCHGISILRRSNEWFPSLSFLLILCNLVFVEHFQQTIQCSWPFWAQCKSQGNDGRISKDDMSTKTMDCCGVSFGDVVVVMLSHIYRDQTPVASVWDCCFVQVLEKLSTTMIVTEHGPMVFWSLKPDQNELMCPKNMVTHCFTPWTQCWFCQWTFLFDILCGYCIYCMSSVCWYLMIMFFFFSLFLWFALYWRFWKVKMIQNHFQKLLFSQSPVASAGWIRGLRTPCPLGSCDDLSRVDEWRRCVWGYFVIFPL